MDQVTISVQQFCEMSGLGKTSAYKLIKIGMLKSKVILGRRLIDAESAIELIAPANDRGDE